MPSIACICSGEAANNRFNLSSVVILESQSVEAAELIVAQSRETTPPGLHQAGRERLSN
jgi:hypothetical protein